MFANMRLNFQGDHMPLLGTMLPPPQAAIADQQLPAGAPVSEQGPSSDPNIASSTRPHEFAHDLFTSINVEDDTMGGSFHSSPPRSTQAPPEGTTSGGAEDLDKLTALSSLVSTLVQMVNSQESDLQAHKLLFKEVVGKLVKRVKLLEDKLKGRKRKVVLTDSDKEEDAELNVDPLIKLAKAAATSVVPTDGFHEAEIPPSFSVPTDDSAGGSKVPAGATTGPSTVYPSSTTVPTTGSVPAAALIPAGSSTTLESPSSPERDARKGKGIAVDKPSPTQHKTFKQLEEERLGREATERLQAQELADFEKQRAESLMKDARQMSQDFDMTEAQRKRQQEVLASAVNYSDAAWDIILARLQENPNLSSKNFRVEFNDDDFAARMVELVLLFTPLAGLWLKFGNSLLHSFKRSLTRSNELLHSQGDIPDAPVKAPSTTASTAQYTGSSPKKVSTRKKRLGRKGVHPSYSTIPIEDGDPEADHKMCIKYASDADSASDDDTPVNLFAVVDWELLPTGLGWINDKQAEGVGLVLWGDLKVLIDSPEVNDGSGVWKNQNSWNIQSWKLYSYSGVHVLEIVGGLVIPMFVDKKYPLSVNLIERMLDHQLDICQDTVGNELTTAVQLIAFLKKQISESQRLKVHD
ncbi:hypothetical protein Tco_0929932 [Tanacetum coccineum]